MKIEIIKNAAIVFAMLTFALLAVFGSVAITSEQPNVPQPILEIEKTLTTGNETVPTKTRVYWELQIDVSYDDQNDLSNVTVKDTLPAEFELINTTVSKGTVGTRDKKGSTKLIWTIGTMPPGDTETLTMWIATGEISGKGKSSPKYHFSKSKKYELNDGAYVSGTHQTGKITAGPTDSIVVNAI